MANEALLAPVSGEDPCGPDLRWDPEFLGLADSLAAAVPQPDAIVEGEVLATEEHAISDVVSKAVELTGRTKDVRVLAIYAEASWYQGGLAAFADAMEDLVVVLETWPGGEDGVHPRADEVDGDLGERAAALGRLMNRIPGLTATVGWGGGATDRDKIAGAAALKGVFGSWTARVEGAFGDDLPPGGEAWRALQRLVGTVEPEPGEGDDADGDAAVLLPRSDAWDLIDDALERMVEQDHHSPALPLLRLLSTWRTLGIIEIVDKMKGSGVTLEQLMESVKRQTQA